MKSSPLFELALRLGDNALVLGQRLSEWTGHGPALEEDLALTNVALDLVGEARLWLSYAGEIEGRGRGEDDLAYFRNADEFRNVLLVELRNGDYAFTMVRQFLFDTWHAELLDALSRSIDARIAAVAQKVSQEVAYHVERSAAWTVRLGDGSEESHARAQAALAALWPYTGELFGSDDVERELARAGVACELETLRAPWLRRAGAVCAEATLAIPDERWAQGGGRSGRHSEHLGYLLAEMQAVRRSVPGDNW